MTVQDLIDFLDTKNPQMQVYVQTHEDSGVFDINARDWIQGYADDHYEFFLETKRWKKEKKDFDCEWSKEALLLKADW